MKKYVAITLLIPGLALAYGASATNEPTIARMERCFKAHAQLMDKSALSNLVACWREHRYLISSVPTLIE